MATMLIPLFIYNHNFTDKASMGFFAGILLGIPVGVYFGERRLNFPLIFGYSESPDLKLHLTLDLAIARALA